MKTEFITGFHLPPGFRFHPSDEELIEHYLLNQLNSRPLPANLIAEIELYNYNPWELPKKALFGEDEWYFFSPRDRKYPNGARPNRATSMGFWKATGTDKPILTSSGSRRIGVKKALMFYTGSPPNGVKTDWIMNEYRLPDMMIRPARLKGSMRLDDWVLCRVRQKGNMSKNRLKEAQGDSTKCMPTKNVEDHQIPSQYTNSYANISFTKDCLFKDCHLLASMLNGQNLPPIEPFSSTSNIPFRSIKDEDFFNQNQSQLGKIFDFDTTNDVINLHEFDMAGRFLQ